uniref:Uncharacterized protein n=1 Tax=Brassica oleracea var. oleracea TaxID=109376 RepID=A0A0D3CG16_BRAOL
MKRLKSYHLSPVALFFVQSCFGESNGEGLTLTVSIFLLVIITSYLTFMNYLMLMKVRNFEGVEALQ